MHERKIIVVDNRERFTQEFVTDYYKDLLDRLKGCKQYLGDQERLAQILSEGLEVRVDLLREYVPRHLPKGYDGYLLHYSQVEKEAIIEIRKEQPWSWIFVVSCGAMSINRYEKSFKEFTDKYDIGVSFPYHIRSNLSKDYSPIHSFLWAVAKGWREDK